MRKEACEDGTAAGEQAEAIGRRCRLVCSLGQIAGVRVEGMRRWSKDGGDMRDFWRRKQVVAEPVRWSGAVRRLPNGPELLRTAGGCVGVRRAVTE